ncbi:MULTISPECIES: hypothetical protein [Novosphingobium]|uniref:hypothetical protein n=1 Tax=Novosphingobium TaxID=165696 RepID=UPI0011DEDDF9|nr:MULTISPECIES: hypothetical protein [Novosphingobium]TYC91535.1 hypothetical protein FMM79_04590 [Novosphingobium sp. BW1]
MTRVAKKVLTTVNAPYGANLSAHQLAEKLVSSDSVDTFDASVFAFFSEVNPPLQKAFIADMGVDEGKVHVIANAFAQKSGFPLALAA